LRAGNGFWFADAVSFAAVGAAWRCAVRSDNALDAAPIIISTAAARDRRCRAPKLPTAGAHPLDTLSARIFPLRADLLAGWQWASPLHVAKTVSGARGIK